MADDSNAEHTGAPVPYSAELAESAPQARWDLRTTYERWRDTRGIPVHTGFYIPDVTSVETAYWDEVGGECAFAEMDGASDSTSAYITKLGEAATTKWRRHLYEEVVYVASGSGRTEVKWGSASVTCSWQAGAVFAVPLNTDYRHVADGGCVLYCVNTSPPMINMIHHDEFLWQNPFEFKDRFDGRDDFFSPVGRMWHAPEDLFSWETNLVPDVITMPLPPLPGRGAGGRNMTFQFGEGALMAHVSEFPVGTYKKAHYHGPSAHVIIVAGTGYSLCWERDFSEHTKVNWAPNSVFVPPDQWWHQHFNTGRTPARYLAIRIGSMKYRLDHSYDGVNTDSKRGGNNLAYADQDPLIHQMFLDECAAKGTVVDTERMFGASAKSTPTS
jgi:uncharacterized RmlC-like cupin family protein